MRALSNLAWLSPKQSAGSKDAGSENPKSEIRRKAETRNPNSEGRFGRGARWGIGERSADMLGA